MAHIFDYLDYRLYLKERYAELKAQHRYFSYRYVTQKVGLKGVGFLTWVIQGKRNLSEGLIRPFAQVFKLKGSEVEYFELLVRFGQAKSQEEKKRYLDSISVFRRAPAKVVDRDAYAFYEQWYYAAICEWVAIRSFHGDPAELAHSLVPPITPTEARKALELLERLGFIGRREDGTYERLHKSLTTGDHWSSVAITHYQQQTLDLAHKALDLIPKSDRDISTLTMSCSRATFEKLRARLAEFRRDCAELVSQDDAPEVVLQFNTQLFPLTKPPRRTLYLTPPDGEKAA